MRCDVCLKELPIIEFVQDEKNKIVLYLRDRGVANVCTSCVSAGSTILKKDIELFIDWLDSAAVKPFKGENTLTLRKGYNLSEKFAKGDLEEYTQELERYIVSLERRILLNDDRI